MDERPAYSIGVVSRRTGVPADTIRAWGRRHGVAIPKRTPGGHRLYSERDIETLRWLRERIGEGMPISNAVALLAGSGPPAGPARNTAESRPAEAIGADLVTALLAFRAEAADLLLSESFALHGVERTCLEVIESTLVAIGDGWHRGEISVAQEHFATHFVTAKLGQLQVLHPLRTRGPIVVTACAPTEQHELGVTMLALFLTWRGIKTVNLGADVPVYAMLESIRELSPKLVCISATTVNGARRATEAAAAIAELDAPPIVVFGGSAFAQHPELREGLNGRCLDGDARAGAEAVAQILGDATSGG